MSTQRQAEAVSPLARPAPVPPAWREATDQEANGEALHFGPVVREPWDYVPVPPFVVDDNGYLISDALPKTDRYTMQMLAYGLPLKARYCDRGFVGVDLSMPYVKGSPGKVLAPDLFVALAAQRNEDRSSYKLWEEQTPDFVLEDLSPANWRRDAVDKRVLYRRLGVAEYWMFDETGKRLRDDSGARLGELLVGYRLHEGEYERVCANDAGRLPSKALGLQLCVRDGLVRFYDPETDEYLLTYDEERIRRTAAEQRAEAAQARVAALEAELRALRDSGERR